MVLPDQKEKFRVFFLSIKKKNCM
ncbi:hypothetical protein Gotur_024819 [Gossypium turneri]